MWLLMALISPSYKQLVELLCVWEKDRQREAIQLSLLFLNDKTDFIYSWCNYWHYISPLHLIYVLLLFSHWVVWFFSTPWTAARQASLSFTSSQSLLKFMSIELMIPSNHLIFCCPLFLLPSIFRSIRIFSNEVALLLIPWVCETLQKNPNKLFGLPNNTQEVNLFFFTNLRFDRYWILFPSNSSLDHECICFLLPCNKLLQV